MTMAPERLSRLQRRILAWLATEGQRTRGTMAGRGRWQVGTVGNLLAEAKAAQPSGRIGGGPGERAGGLMSGDVITTIKEYVWILALISLMLGSLSAYFGGGWGRKGITWTFTLTRTRKLRRLQERRAWFQRLHDSDREYYGWLLSNVLWVLGMLAVVFIVGTGGTSTTPLAAKVARTLSAVAGILATLVAMECYVNYLRLLNFDYTMARLNYAIARLETKLGAHQPAAAA
jgi:hypothetical protein